MITKEEKLQIIEDVAKIQLGLMSTMYFCKKWDLIENYSKLQDIIYKPLEYWDEME